MSTITSDLACVLGGAAANQPLGRAVTVKIGETEPWANMRAMGEIGRTLGTKLIPLGHDGLTRRAAIKGLPPDQVQSLAAQDGVVELGIAAEGFIVSEPAAAKVNGYLVELLSVTAPDALVPARLTVFLYDNVADSADVLRRLLDAADAQTVAIRPGREGIAAYAEFEATPRQIESLALAPEVEEIGKVVYRFAI